MSKQEEIPKGEEITGSIVRHMDRRFISSLDLVGVGKVTMTIAKVEKHETLKYRNGNTDENAILIYFKETPKPLKLCATNIKAIITLLESNKVSDWHGKKITIAATKIQAFGKTTDAVRVVE